MAEGVFQFKVGNGEVTAVFSCNLLNRRINETRVNLRCEADDERLTARFISTQPHVEYSFNGECFEGDCKHKAVFFENTDYPLLVRTEDGAAGPLKLSLAGHVQENLSSNEGMLYGAINFGNQVGLTDFTISYWKDGRERTLSFQTEVLSYKMDYRSDLRAMILDIEREYSMLSYSFLKKTYLTYKEKSGASTDLIWWQIFQQCHDDIIRACQQIINSPKRKLKATHRYERAERMPYILPEIENEYAEFKTDERHLYRTEELILSKDTIENRFLKYVMRELQRKYGRLKGHIKESLRIERDDVISGRLEQIENDLTHINRHPFFRGIGPFHGFSQDSIVMKKAHGYSTIYRNWILLSCGYEIEEGVRKLEVKDISELYEIWCFIKIKNMVTDIMRDEAEAVSGQEEALSEGLIRQLAYGKQSEVKLMKNRREQVSLMYNATTSKDRRTSAISETGTYTTTQRPDIVLRLTKEREGIKFTYLFDAKYRIDDYQIRGLDVPPEDAIDQMHRYRDAIYYNKEGEGRLKKEVIGGYVLFPGNMERDRVKDSYYYRSIEKVGIGAFPLRPTAYETDEEGNLQIPADSSEHVLKEQLRAWIEDRENYMHNLLEAAIPQKGLSYRVEPQADEQAYVLVGYYKLAQTDWIFNAAATGQYNIRALGDLTRFLNVKYLLLHTQDAPMSDQLYEVMGNVRVMSQEQIKKIGYQTSYYDGSYFVYNFMKTKVVLEEGNQWDTAHLPHVAMHGLPFLVTLKELKEFMIIC